MNRDVSSVSVANHVSTVCDLRMCLVANNSYSIVGAGCSLCYF